MATDAIPDDGDAPTDAPIQIGSTDELDTLVDEQPVVFVDFYADWCGPCKMIEPVVERLAAETEAAVAKVDVDATPELAASYGVQGVPTMALFADGRQEEQIVGARPGEQLRSLVEQYTG